MKCNIVITGATSGLGEGLAQLLLTQGEHTIIAVARNAEKLNTLQSLAKHTEHAHTLKCDLTNQQQIIELANKIKKITDTNKQSIYIAHCAGVAMHVPFMKISQESLTQILAPNLFAPLFLTQQLLPIMNHGRVLFVSSGLATHTFPDMCEYSISKAALHMVAKSINTEISPSQAIAAILIPGIFDSPMQQRLRNTEGATATGIFKRFKAEGSPRPINEVARFVRDVLLDATDEGFKNNIWDIDGAQWT